VNVSFATAASAPNAANEDYVLATPDVVVLLDGSGVPPGSETGCKHGLPWFVRTLAAQLVDQAQDAERTLKQAVGNAIALTATAHEATCDPMHPQSPSATVVAVRPAPSGEVDWLVLGDSFLVLRTEDGFEAITDQRLKQSAVQQRTALRQAEADNHGLWTELVAEERRLRNHPEGYWIAAGEPTAADHALAGTTQRQDLTHALLFSDGGARPVEPFAATTWEECFQKLVQAGPSGWLSHVREVEASDPDRTRWPRSKRHDDVTAVLAEL
jgi:serine/threonine protein phosphatase PrpC